MQTRAGSISPAVARGSITLAGTFTQRPSEPGSAQNTQRPVQAESQQTPSTHWPPWHSAPCWQAWPSPFLPQLPAWQELGGMQSAVTAQLPRQALFAHMNGAQLMGELGKQVPSPSQTLGGTKLAPEQEAGRQTVPAACRAQPPRPLQTPVCPQLSGACRWQTSRGSTWPAGTGEHWPHLPGSRQLTQGPPQALLQQTPSTQWPDSHSAAAAQVAPEAFLPQLPLLQASPAHWPSPVQPMKQLLVAGSQP
jgi:hypothetical protein